MAIESGARRLHCRIVDKLGEGGMGVLRRPVDTALEREVARSRGREVAIKMLPESVTVDAEQRTAPRTGLDLVALLGCATGRPRRCHDARSTT